MTKAEALDKLIEAVEAGEAAPKHFNAVWNQFGPEWPIGHKAALADEGSLDAAKALHEALLPDDYITLSDSTGYARVWRDEFEFTHSWGVLVPGKEAVARLLATLKAYRAGL